MSHLGKYKPKCWRTYETNRRQN